MARVLLFYSLLSAFMAITCSATSYTVGDTSGWDVSTNLETWVADKKFNVGDALFFQYTSSHSVDEVTRENYGTCNTTNILAGYGNGNTTVPLTRAGDRYFVCGNRLHCLGGMKLHVHVEGSDQALSPTQSPAQSPEAVAGSDQNTATLPQSRPSNKNTPNSNGVVNCSWGALHLVYVALFAAVFGMLQF